jgi:hypothetical protein
MEFNLSFLDKCSYECLQHAIDGVNKALLHDPGAWAYVSAGKLIEGYKDDPIAKTIFNEMEQDRHSGASGGWTIHALTQIAKNFPKWRDEVLVDHLVEMKGRLEDFIMTRSLEKFPEEELEWFVRRGKVLHDMEHSYLARHVLTDTDRKTLEYLSKMENVSHLGNEVLFDMIEEYLGKL